MFMFIKVKVQFIGQILCQVVKWIPHRFILNQTEAAKSRLTSSKWASKSSAVLGVILNVLCDDLLCSPKEKRPEILVLISLEQNTSPIPHFPHTYLNIPLFLNCLISGSSYGCG
mgnify:CR=1 FL=1